MIKYMYMCSPSAGAERPQGTKFWCHQKGLITFVCLCWGLTSQSTIFQSYRDGGTPSWVINQYFRGVKCLAQGHNTAAVGFEPPTSRSGVRHSTTEPPRSPLSLFSSVASFKEISSKSDFIQLFSWFNTCIQFRGRGQNFDVNRKALSLYHLLQISKKSLWSLILYNCVHDLIHVYSPRD